MKGEFNIISEYIVLTFALLILFMMKSTNPKKTKIYRVTYAGICLSSFEILLNQLIISLSLKPINFNHLFFDLLCLSFFGLYTVLLILIMFYIHQLSYIKRNETKCILILSAIFFTVSISVYSYLIFTGRLYSFTNSGVQFTKLYNIFLLFGSIAAVLILLITLKNRQTIAKKNRYYVYTAVFFEIILLLFQYSVYLTIFASFTYTTPFIIFYMLFHSNPYDEISGCQNIDSYITRINENLDNEKSFFVATMYFPKYKNIGSTINPDLVNLAAAQKCQQMQAINRSIYLYRINSYTFTLLANVDNIETEVYIVEQIKNIMSVPISFENRLVKPLYKMIAYSSFPALKNYQNLSSFEDFLFDKLKSNLTSECYQASQKDFDDFSQSYQVEQTLQLINSTHNLDDSHILCYAQPIFNVKKNGFRTAEALMRMQIDGKMIYPNIFIPIAEKTACIHTLTCIMLNKVCKEINILSESHDFDAITVNCSTLELADPELHNELLQIIRDNGVDTSKICLELTESAMINDYDAIQKNIQYLRKEGVQFYLDDFGTGYSNLERIITCPFKTIKFDKSLLYKSMDDHSVGDLMESMVDVFKRQGFQLLVEGVEDSIQNDYSIEKGFDFIQGYKYSKPVPIEHLSEFFSQK